MNGIRFVNDANNLMDVLYGYTYKSSRFILMLYDSKIDNKQKYFVTELLQFICLTVPFDVTETILTQFHLFYFAFFAYLNCIMAAA